MKLKKIEWEAGRYGTINGFIKSDKKIQMFSIFYDSLRSRSEVNEKPYILSNNLPGFKKRIEVESQEKGKELAEFLLGRFVDRITE